MKRHISPSFLSPGLLIFPVLFFLSYIASAQDGVRIASTAGTADPSALLDVISSTKGILIPRMLASERTAISSPATGLLVYQTNGTPGFYYNAGTPAAPNWIILSAGAISGVGLANYAARWTTSSLLGTGILYDDGSAVAIGTTTPASGSRLDVTNGDISTNRYIRIRPWNDDAATYGTGAGSIWYKGTGGTSGVLNNSFVVDNGNWIVQNGNIGVGTLNPAQKLSVAGIIESTTGGIKFPDGTIQPTASVILQVKHLVWTTTTSSASAFNYIDAAGSDIAITAKKSGSIFKVTVHAQGYQSGAGGSNIGIKYVNANALIAGVNGTSGDTWAAAGNGTSTTSWNITRVAFHNPGTVAGSTYTYRAMLGLWSSGTNWVNYPGYSTSSIIMVEEIAQ